MNKLLPDRNKQTNFFICDITDTFKDDMASMEHPIFSLNKAIDLRVLRYERNNVVIEVSPSAKGLATIYDKDILLYLASALVNAKNNNEAISKVVKFSAYDYLAATNKSFGGTQYQVFKDGLERLAGTRIQTNIKTNNVEITNNFGLIDTFTIIKENSKSKAIAVEVVLSEWFYNSILGNEVLTIHRDYFRLRKPTERRLYELARKHCGNQPSWKIKLSTIQEKIGITSQLKQFRYNIKAIIEDDHLPEYNISMENDVVTFSRKQPPKPISNYQFSKTTQATNTTEAINQSSNDEMNILDEYALARRRFGDIAVIPEEYIFILKQQGRW